MSKTAQRPIPPTPRVISPTPPPTETNSNAKGDYFGPVTRSVTKRSTGRRKGAGAVDEDAPVHEGKGSAGSSSSFAADGDRSSSFAAKNVNDDTAVAVDDNESSSGSDPDRRARSRSRSIDDVARRRALGGMTAAKPKMVDGAEDANGHLQPESVAARYWRELSRSPSPLGLIPIHRSWRSFIHRHEIPRKALHVSIGFFTLGLYTRGAQPATIHPYLLAALLPISALDLARHSYPPLNRVYIRAVGAFMRESEAHDRYNGVIWYLLGAWAVLRFCPKDVGVMGVVLLSWCDTAASTFGRLLGRHTPRVRRGKSVAGSAAAFVVGVAGASLFWGWVVPASAGTAGDTGENAFAFQGWLGWPGWVRGLLGYGEDGGMVEGPVAVGLVSVWAGLVASVAEAVDVFGWDDNVTIPILCGAGLWGFLRVFGAA